ncbi:2-hydroxymuconate semialdehyde hydrolase [Thermoflexales bacterium]|nr:2-hydroxymuconate semialdehyde hydrolase [Thermoflexales bacterium]
MIAEKSTVRHNRPAFEHTDRDVPRQAVDELVHFRESHSLKHVVVNGVAWEYFAAGRGSEALLILPGLLGFGEMSFQHIQAFENDYCVIAPNYPWVFTTVKQLVDGIVGILDAEDVQQAHVLGGSYGGMVAQCLVRRYPQRVRSLVLSHTGGPKPDRAGANRKFVALLRLLPMRLLRVMLRAATRKSLRDAPAQLPFWEAYSNEMIARLSKADLMSRYQVAIDFDASAAFTPDDLKDWPGRSLILEGDNDPIAEAPAREALKVLHPHARLHTFHGSGHVASIAKLDEYVTVIKNFLKAG